MDHNSDGDIVEAKRRELAARMRHRGDDDSIANDIKEEDLYKLEKRLDEQERQKKWGGHISFKTKPPTPIYTWPPLQTDDLPRDSAVIKQHEKEKKIYVLETTVKELRSNCEKINHNISELSRDGSENQLVHLEGLKNDLEKELAQKEEELAKLKEM